MAKAVMPARKKSKQPAIADLGELHTLLRKVEASGASPVTLIGSRLLALTAVRAGGATGRIVTGVRGHRLGVARSRICERAAVAHPFEPKLVVDRKKDDTYEHLVPLSRQAVEALAAIRALTRRDKLVFPSASDAHRPMSENANGYPYTAAAIMDGMFRTAGGPLSLWS